LAVNQADALTPGHETHRASTFGIYGVLERAYAEDWGLLSYGHRLRRPVPSGPTYVDKILLSETRTSLMATHKLCDIQAERPVAVPVEVSQDRWRLAARWREGTDEST